jgi:hypothetical protein
MSEEQSTQSTSEPSQAIESLSFAEFLESIPPSQTREVIAPGKITTQREGRAVKIAIDTPEIQLHCPGVSCNGERFFRTEDENYVELTLGISNFQYELSTRAQTVRAKEKFSLSA